MLSSSSISNLLGIRPDPRSWNECSPVDALSSSPHSTVSPSRSVTPTLSTSASPHGSVAATALPSASVPIDAEEDDGAALSSSTGSEVRTLNFTPHFL